MIAELEFQPGVIIARTPYIEGYVEELKRLIPSAYRRWDPDAKTWIISALCERDFLILCYRYFDDVRTIGDDYRPPAQQASQSPATSYATLHLLPSAPPELVDSAYRCLARLTHPDRNPNPLATTQMQALNAAYEDLKNREAS